MTDWSSFFPTLIATGVGVVLGIPAGLFVERRGERLRSKGARLADDRRRNDLLRLIREAIGRNHGVIAEVQKVAVLDGQPIFEPPLVIPHVHAVLVRARRLSGTR